MYVGLFCAIFTSRKTGKLQLEYFSSDFRDWNCMCVDTTVNTEKVFIDILKGKCLRKI